MGVAVSSLMDIGGGPRARVVHPVGILIQISQ